MSPNTRYIVKIKPCTEERVNRQDMSLVYLSFTIKRYKYVVTFSYELHCTIKYKCRIFFATFITYFLHYAHTFIAIASYSGSECVNYN